MNVICARQREAARFKPRVLLVQLGKLTRRIPGMIPQGPREPFQRQRVVCAAAWRFPFPFDRSNGINPGCDVNSRNGDLRHRAKRRAQREGER